ncbi:preprotein translocase subunit YajC [Actinoplanes awajinensis subsp. mycoplanecinus]|uniref:Preprotein translocase subunit YajC n=1 Tax=Actinoplanes awajinensis subsp. mycoplanecinus TaxID=135947 RepID=A0A101JIS8_9ACTN|nr:preprotein translocase subunit YajC [Actinoplanes palleronii]KUL27186.1 preprotein translocase subunit YajC [Actinoplanes awajinensis subsp. mycoplanecinus]
MYLAESASGNPLGLFLPFILIIGVMYFLMIRPQQKKRREAMEMQNKIGPGDEIVTIGGLHGTVVGVADDVVTLEIAPDVQVRFARPAIARVLTRADEPVAEESVTDESEAEEPVVAEPSVEEPVNPVVDVRKKD